MYFCDDARHLVCVPYSVENLHAMAAELGIKRCWYHAHPTHGHYDVPKKRQAEIAAKCQVVTKREILDICSGSLGPPRTPSDGLDRLGWPDAQA